VIKDKEDVIQDLIKKVHDVQMEARKKRGFFSKIGGFLDNLF